MNLVNNVGLKIPPYMTPLVMYTDWLPWLTLKQLDLYRICIATRISVGIFWLANRLNSWFWSTESNAEEKSINIIAVVS